MMATEHEVEKLLAIGYEIGEAPLTLRWFFKRPGSPFRLGSFASRGEAAEAAKAHAQCPNGAIATLAAKVSWLTKRPLSIHLNYTSRGDWSATATDPDNLDAPAIDAFGVAVEAAVDALFWMVP